MKDRTVKNQLVAREWMLRVVRQDSFSWEREGFDTEAEARAEVERLRPYQWELYRCVARGENPAPEERAA